MLTQNKPTASSLSLLSPAHGLGHAPFFSFLPPFLLQQTPNRRQQQQTRTRRWTRYLQRSSPTSVHTYPYKTTYTASKSPELGTTSLSLFSGKPSTTHCTPGHGSSRPSTRTLLRLPDMIKTGSMYLCQVWSTYPAPQPPLESRHQGCLYQVSLQQRRG